MHNLAPDYKTEIDNADENTWYDIISGFNDANIYQTWAYDEIRFGRNKMSHLILKNNDVVVAAAQIRIVKIPIIGSGIAYVFWGPLWKLKNTKTNPDIFRQAIRALRNEYSVRRGLLLRIYPVLFSDETDIFIPILKDEGFILSQKESSRTLIVDLSPDIDAIRKGLNQKWRNCLNRAIKNNLELIEGHSIEIFEMFMSLYRQLLDRKQFAESNDINEFRLIQEKLPVNYKMKIILCKFEGEIVTGAVFSAIGNKGVYIFGATNEHGMKSNGSYLIQWKFMEWLKENQFVCYDLNGINPVANLGTYKFKEGLCGKNGKDVNFLGKFEVCDNKVSAITIKYGDLLIANYKKIKANIHKYRNSMPVRF